jgi:hypothetical protein
MAYFLNDKRYVEETRSDGKLEHREIKSYYMDSAADVNSLPGNDLIDETSTAFVPETGELFVLMTNGWIKMA